jgi:7-carboxy-7-deazaguanine synthase
MSYAVKELFYTLQGEGARAGRAAVFLRFSGCNLWNGMEAARAAATCRFCDTDFVGTDGDGGGKFADAESLAAAVAAAWPDAGATQRYVVCTGGEPLLQLDEALIAALHARDFEIGIETNGTLKAPRGVEWICVSPKAGTDLAITSGQELKLVYPQDGAPPEKYAALMFDHFFVQPMDGPELAANTRAATEYCLAHPQWRLSLQTHKLIGIR